MSIDTVSKRASAINPGLPFRTARPIPDGALNRLDRIELAYLYAAFIINITSTNTIQLPVDCVLAGNQRAFGIGDARFELLKRIFRE